MTNEELDERNNNPMVKKLKDMISDKTKGKKYVFISYKSDDWKIVLTKILFKLATRYGLNFYYDGSFDLHNKSWIKQFPENMQHSLCVGVLAFLDDKYATSYATLMELMHSQTIIGGELEIIPVNLEDLKETDSKIADIDTGLGKKTFEDGKENVIAQEEMALFDADYDELKDRPSIKKEFKYSYRKGQPLTKKLCSNMVRALLASTKSSYNTNMYSDSKEFYNNLYETIKNSFGEDVFSEVTEEEIALAEEIEKLAEKTEKPAEETKKPVEKTEKPVTEERAENVPHSVSPKAEKQDVPESGSENSASNKLITYSLYGKKYTDNQTNMMLNVFAKVLNNHPEAVDKILENPEKPLLRCASAINYDLPENKKLDKPSRYNTGGYLPVGRGIYIGTGLNYEEKLRNISLLFQVCGEDFSVLRSDQIELKSNVKTRESSSGDENYTIDGKQFSGNQSRMMIDVIRYMMEQHFDKREQLSALLSIKLAPLSELSDISYFRAGEEFNYSGTVYSIGTSFGRNDKLKQIIKAAAICGEDPKQFNIAGLESLSAGAGHSTTRARRNFLED